MSMYLQIGASGGPTIIASNQGYGDLCRWVGALDATKYPELQHLCQYGWCQHLDDLYEQIGLSVSHENPSQDVNGIAETVMDLLMHRDGSAQSCTVTDGLG